MRQIEEVAVGVRSGLSIGCAISKESIMLLIASKRLLVVVLLLSISCIALAEEYAGKTLVLRSQVKSFKPPKPKTKPAVHRKKKS